MLSDLSSTYRVWTSSHTALPGVTVLFEPLSVPLPDGNVPSAASPFFASQVSMSQTTVVVFGLGAPSYGSPTKLGHGVGGYAVRHAAAAGYTVRAVARDPSKYSAIFSSVPGVELVKGDVTDAVSTEAAVRGANAAIFAVQAPDGLPATAVDRDGLIVLAKACQEAGAKLIVISSVLVEPRNRFHPIRLLLNSGLVKSGMMDAKFAGEEFVREKVKTRHTIIRPAGLSDGGPSTTEWAISQGDSSFPGWRSISKTDVARIAVAAVSDRASDYTTFEVNGGSSRRPVTLEVFSKLKKDPIAGTP